ncbi:MAG: CobD/CbiB family cobalamin biosynthesis protein, partial [Jatrophihabitantaceae bacterium]
MRRGPALAVGLLAGTALDALVGDPRSGHPVAAFGQVASMLERRMWCDSRVVGAAFAAACVGGAVTAGAILEQVAAGGRRYSLTAALATWTVLGGTSLRREAGAIAQLLASDDLPAARRRVTNLVGRDPSRLDESQIARAVVESVAENMSDAVVAPLVWGACAGVPGLLGYRALNTLDAMVGHRSARYRRFGWASARLDDLANVVPARVTAALTALVSERPREVWRV